MVALIDASKQEERRRQFRVKRNFSLAVTLALVFAGLGALAWYQERSRSAQDEIDRASARRGVVCAPG